MMMTSPIKNKLTKRIRAKDIPRYWKDTFRDKKPVHIYTNMDPITVPIPVGEIHSLVNITIENFRLVCCQFKPGVKNYDIFIEMVRKFLPAQLSPSYSNI